MKNFGSFDLMYSEEKLEIKNEQIVFSFFPTKAIFAITGTKVKYQYYYTHKYDDLSFYDTKFIQYHDTEYLYDVIMQRLLDLSGQELLYQEGTNCCKLSTIDEEHVFFLLNSSKKKKTQYNKSTTIYIEKVVKVI